jgi:excisionase family DNA binding protein
MFWLWLFSAKLARRRKKTRERSGGAVELQELLTYEDVARITKFKISTLRKWVQLRKIPFSKINGSIRFNPDAIRTWAAGEQGASKNGAARAHGGKDLFSDAEGDEG